MEASGHIWEHLGASWKHLWACGFSLGPHPIRHHRNTIPRTICCTTFAKIWPCGVLGGVFRTDFCTFWVIVGVLGRPLGPPWGTKKSTWDHPGAPSQPDTKNNQNITFWVPVLKPRFDDFLFFWTLLLHVFQMWQVMSKWIQNVSKRCAPSTPFKQQV